MPAEQAYAWPEDIVALHRAALDAPKPMIALVDGPAYAGGMGLAGMCDILLVTERARFAMPEIRMGLFPMIIVAHLARARAPQAAARPDADRPADRRRRGLPRRLRDPGLRRHGRAVEGRRRVRRRGSPRPARWPPGWAAARSPCSPTCRPTQALDAAQFLNLTFFLGSDLAEGAAAFLEKRSPRWVRPGGGPLMPTAYVVGAVRSPVGQRNGIARRDPPRRPRARGAARAGRTDRRRPRTRSTTCSGAASARWDRRRRTSAGRRCSPPGLPGEGARRDHRPAVRVVAAGAALRRAGGAWPASRTSSSPAGSR